MSWLIIFISSLVSAAIIAYALWPGPSGNRTLKMLISLLVLGVFALPAGLKLYLQDSPEINNTTSGYSPPAPDKSIWSGNMAGPSNNMTKDMSMSAVTARLEQKLEKTPDDIKGWILLGRSYSALGDTDRARELFQKKITEYPDNIDLLVSYGETLAQMNQGIITEEAVKIFRKVAGIQGDNPRAGYNLALYEIQNKHYQQAYDRLDHLIKKAPQNAPWASQLEKQKNIAARNLNPADTVP